MKAGWGVDAVLFGPDVEVGGGGVVGCSTIAGNAESDRAGDSGYAGEGSEMESSESREDDVSGELAERGKRVRGPMGD